MEREGRRRGGGVQVEWDIEIKKRINEGLERAKHKTKSN